MSGLPGWERLGRGQVLLRGSALAHVSRLADVGARVVERGDGIAPHPELRRLLEELRAEAAEVPAVSATGHADVRGPGGWAESGAMGWTDPVDGGEAALMLGVGVRQLRRLAPSLGGRKVGGSWVFERAAVAAFAAERKAG